MMLGLSMIFVQEADDVAVSVGVGVSVAVSAGVPVSVLVGVLVGGVPVTVGISVAVGVAVWVGVGVIEGKTPPPVNRNRTMVVNGLSELSHHTCKYASMAWLVSPASSLANPR